MIATDGIGTIADPVNRPGPARQDREHPPINGCTRIGVHACILTEPGRTPTVLELAARRSVTACPACHHADLDEVCPVCDCGDPTSIIGPHRPGRVSA